MKEITTVREMMNEMGSCGAVTVCCRSGHLSLLLMH